MVVETYTTCVTTRLLPQALTANMRQQVLLAKLHPDKCSEYPELVQGSGRASIELQERLQMKKPVDGRHHDAPQWFCLGGAADASLNLLTGR